MRGGERSGELGRFGGWLAIDAGSRRHWAGRSRHRPAHRRHARSSASGRPAVRPAPRSPARSRRARPRTRRRCSREPPQMRNASPRPVPGANTAIGACGSGWPWLMAMVSDGSRCGTAWAMARRSFNRLTRRRSRFSGQFALGQVPGQVGQVRLAADHRPRDVEAGGRGGGAGGLQKRPHDRLQPRKIPARIDLLRQEFARAGVRRDQRQACVRSPDIAGDQHPVLPVQVRAWSGGPGFLSSEEMVGPSAGAPKIAHLPAGDA